MKKISISFLIVLTMLSLAACGGGGSGNAFMLPADTKPPIVAATNPADGSQGVAVNLTQVTATFSEAMGASSIGDQTFTINNGAAGTVSYDSASKTAVFTLSGNLQYNTTYTATITTGAKDKAGNAMSADYIWSFTTGSAPAPAVPVGIAATGSLGNIHVSWSASTGADLTGYNVYKSTDGAVFTKVNATPITETFYDDTIASPAGDGIFYYYRVTAAGDAESSPSSIVKSIHGTRLASNLSSGFTTTIAESPYVAEGTVVVDGGDLEIDTNTKLYVLDNAVIDIEQGRAFYVYGVLRVLATAGANSATFTSHGTGGVALNDGEGFSLNLVNCVSYNFADNSGTLLQNATINNLSVLGWEIVGCSPRLYNLKVTANTANGLAYFYIYWVGASAIVSHCSFTNMIPNIGVDLRATSFKMDHNIFQNSYYSISFWNLTNPGVNAGQIENNVFDGAKSAYLWNMTGGTNVPVGNNYWAGGAGNPPLPGVIQGGTTTITYDFNTALSSAPAGAGPTW